ncbi:MAG: methyl-accepting chemotaxis protein [Desulfobacterales bacterium]
MKPVIKILKIFNRLSLSKKLLAASFLFIFLICAMGAGGLIAVSKIHGKIKILSEVIHPSAANSLVENLRQSQIAISNLPQAKDESALSGFEKAVALYEASSQNQLQSLNEKLQESDIRVDLEPIREMRAGFFDQVLKVMESHRHQNAMEKEVNARIQSFRTQHHSLQDLLDIFITDAQASLNKKEDGGRTLVQSGYATIEDMHDLLKNLFESNVPLLAGGISLQGYLIQLQRIAETYVSEKDSGRLKKLRNDFEQTGKKIGNRIKKLNRYMLSEADNQHYTQLKTEFEKLREIVTDEQGLFSIHDRFLETLAEIEDARGFLDKTVKNFESALVDITETLTVLNKKAKTETEKEVRFSRHFIGIFILLGVMLSLSGALLLGIYIERPLREVTKGLSDSVFAAASASDQIASASQKVAEGASGQAAASEQASASLNEMSKAGEITSNLTMGAGDLMKENIKKSVKTVRLLTDLTEKIRRVENDSDQIAQIIKNIDEIAFQTRLLALNAAIEAARAGENGSGFAVVAQEVKNLALRTTEAAKSTQELLDRNLLRISESVKSIASINRDFSGIVASATSMGDKTKAITDASRTLAHSIKQIHEGVREMDRVAQENAANAEELAGASETLHSQAEHLAKYMEKLTPLIGTSAAVFK